MKNNLKLKNKKTKRKKKTISLFEIIILFFGIFSFSYLLSDNIKNVSAEDTNDNSERDRDNNDNVAPISSSPGLTPVAQGFLSAGAMGISGTIFALVGGKELLTKIGKEITIPISQVGFWGWIGGIIENGAIATGLYFGSKWIASIIWPNNPELQDQLAASLTGGYLGGQILGVLFRDSLGKQLIGSILGTQFPLLTVGGAIGIVVGVLIFLATAQKEKIITVSYTCSEWQAPLGGKDCEKCNEGKFPCNAYKCKSLGAGCELVNEGSEFEKCIFSSPNDFIAPIIKTWNGALKENYSYVNITANGARIKYTGNGADENGCIPYYTSFKYGVSLNEEAQCRYDTEDKEYSEMANIASKGLGGEYYLKNHTMITYYTSFNVSNETGTEFNKDGEYSVYVKCQDKSGNTNNIPFVFKYCAQTKPDLDPPIIIEELSVPLNNFPVAKDQSSINATIYLNKPSTCSWSKENKEVSLMENEMSCDYNNALAINGKIVFKCVANLTGLQNEILNKFYFNCRSYPMKAEKDRFSMTTNYEYKLQGTRDLVIQSVSPSNDSLIKGNSININVTLNAITMSGYENGKAICYYKRTENPESSYITFYNTGGTSHSQVLWLTNGEYSYDIRCNDLAGNYDKKTLTFKVESDTTSPVVIRMYNENNKIKIITNEQASCFYDIQDCSYDINEGNPLSTTNGKEHYLDYYSTGGQNTYYIKCKDSYGNTPLASQCSVIVKPINL